MCRPGPVRRRGFYSRRARVRVKFVETVDDAPAWATPEPEGYGNIVFRDVLAFLDKRERLIVLSLGTGRTVSEMARRATAIIRLSRSGSRGSRKRPVDCSGNAVGRGAGCLSRPRHQPGRTGSVRRNRVWRITIAAPSSFRRKRSLTVAVRRERWCAPSSQASGFLPGDVRFVRTRSLALGALMCRVRCVLTSPRLRGAGGGQAWRALVTS